MTTQELIARADRHLDRMANGPSTESRCTASWDYTATRQLLIERAGKGDKIAITWLREQFRNRDWL